MVAISRRQQNFASRSQYILAKASRNRFCEALFFVYTTANFEGTLPPILGKQKAGITPSLCMNIQFLVLILQRSYQNSSRCWRPVLA